MERITKFSPAFDKRHDDTNKNYGIGAVHCYMVLKGDKGAVHFTFSTGMYLESTMQEYANDGKLTPRRRGFGLEGYSLFPAPMGYDVGYHSPVPTTEYQKERPGRECDWIGTKCWGDGSALRADAWMDILIAEGSDKIWSMLEQEYAERFLNMEPKAQG